MPLDNILYKINVHIKTKSVTLCLSNDLLCVLDALSAAPSALEGLRVQFCMKTGGPPPGQSVLVHLGQQHHRTLAKTTQILHFSARKSCLSTAAAKLIVRNEKKISDETGSQKKLRGGKYLSPSLENTQYKRNTPSNLAA